MGFSHFLSNHAFDLVSSLTVIGSLLLTVFELRQVKKAHRIQNLFTITQNHREIWSNLYERPDLARVLRLNVKLVRKPITREEEIFVTSIILHLHAAFRASQEQMFITPEALEKDVREFFSLPIPGTLWEKAKALQDQDFVHFVESAKRGLSDENQQP